MQHLQYFGWMYIQVSIVAHGPLVFCCRCGYRMHVSVYENCRIRKHFNLVQKSSRHLERNKSYDQLHPGTAVQNSSQIPVGAQGFVGSSPCPGCIMIYSYYQMCPALNAKPYWSNEQVVPLLGCCFDAPGSPGNRLVICGDHTFFLTQFSSPVHARNLPGKNCCTFASLCDRK